jgi:hypothetical protein
VKTISNVVPGWKKSWFSQEACMKDFDHAFVVLQT